MGLREVVWVDFDADASAALEVLCGAFNEPGAPYLAISYVRGIDVRIALQASVKSSQPIARALRVRGPAQTPNGRRHGVIASFKMLIALTFRLDARVHPRTLLRASGPDTPWFRR